MENNWVHGYDVHDRFYLNSEFTAPGLGGSGSMAGQYGQVVLKHMLNVQIFFSTPTHLKENLNS